MATLRVSYHLHLFRRALCPISISIFSDGLVADRFRPWGQTWANTACPEGVVPLANLYREKNLALHLRRYHWVGDPSRSHLALHVCRHPWASQQAGTELG